MNDRLLNEPIFDIETWRGRWFYKVGSRYTGPFQHRADAIAAADKDLSPLETCQRAPLRASLAKATSFSDFG